MNTEELTQLLKATLTDQRLSGSEKSTFSDWFTANASTDHHRGVVRHTVFEIARESLTTISPDRVLAWVEDVMRVVAPMPTPAATGNEPTRAGTSQVYFSPGERCLQQILHRFSTCRSTADVCIFTITDDRITRSILDSHRRGITVRIITDNEKVHDAGSDVHQLMEAGIPVKLDDERGGRSDPGLSGHMHHKFAIFDGIWLINGSYNWTRGAANSNFENIVDCRDANLLASFADEFNRLWNRF